MFGTILWPRSGIPCDEKSPIRGLVQSTSEYGWFPPIENLVAFPLRDGEEMCWFIDHVTPGPQFVQTSYFGGYSPYPVQPPVAWRLLKDCPVTAIFTC